MCTSSVANAEGQYWRVGEIRDMRMVDWGFSNTSTGDMGGVVDWYHPKSLVSLVLELLLEYMHACMHTVCRSVCLSVVCMHAYTCKLSNADIPELSNGLFPRSLRLSHSLSGIFQHKHNPTGCLGSVVMHVWVKQLWWMGQWW